MPAPLDEAVYAQVCELARRAHMALGCRGVTRSDFRYDGQDFYLLETNTQPGMTPLSLTPEIAAHVGMDFTALVTELIETARLD
jgi:D-alanine-D-alanine ligase